MSFKFSFKRIICALIFSAVVASVGVVGVSFAEWTERTTVKISLTTGSISLFGFIDDSPIFFDSNDKLIPYDQYENANDIPVGMTTVLKANIPAYHVSDSYKLTVKLTSKNLSNSTVFYSYIADSGSDTTPPPPRRVGDAATCRRACLYGYNRVYRY